MPYYDAQGNAMDAGAYGAQFNDVTDLSSWAARSGWVAQNQKLGAAYASANTTAEREANEYEAGANAQTAERTNSLAQQLASARRTPGGGIRRGMGRGKGLTAGNATPGLTSANAASKLGKRKAELRAQVDEEFANKPVSMTGSTGFGSMIYL